VSQGERSPRYLQERSVEVHVLETREAVKVYNDLAEDNALAGLFTQPADRVCDGRVASAVVGDERVVGEPLDRPAASAQPPARTPGSALTGSQMRDEILGSRRGTRTAERM
jgi:hypothetical protein